MFGSSSNKSANETFKPIKLLGHIENVSHFAIQIIADGIEFIFIDMVDPMEIHSYKSFFVRLYFSREREVLRMCEDIWVNVCGKVNFAQSSGEHDALNRVNVTRSKWYSCKDCSWAKISIIRNWMSDSNKNKSICQLFESGGSYLKVLKSIEEFAENQHVI